MNLIELYIEKRKGIPVTHKNYPNSLEMHNAGLVVVRFSHPNKNMYFILKSRFGFGNIVVEEDRALNIIHNVEVTSRYGYIVIDSDVLPPDKYYQIKSRIIKYLCPEPCGMPQMDEWW